MTDRDLVICLPIQDRRRAYEFFTEGMGFLAVGPIAEDGLPEPLQLHVSANVRIMLVPTGGFEAITGGRAIAGAEASECVLTLPVPDHASVSRLLESAVAAGAAPVMPASQQPWGFVASFADPDGHLWMLRSE